MVVGKRTRVLDLSNISAREYFLKSTSYCNVDLPDYFNFEVLLKQLSEVLELQGTNIFFKNVNQTPKLSPRLCDNVNYHILVNKSAKYAWRRLQLINPVLYVVLVHKITESAYWDEIIKRFELFYANPKIFCSSCPIDSSDGYTDKAAQISEWWEKNEQNSIELALEFDYLLHTDIENCYGSIYTHSIPWSLHGKEESKKKENDKKLEEESTNTGDEGIENIEDIKVLKVNPFDQFGTPTKIIKMFGGKSQYLHALTQLEKELYQAAS